MRKTKLLLVALVAMLGSSVSAVEYEIDQKFTSVAELDGQLFTIVNEDEAKAFCFPSNQDMAYSLYSDAMAANSYYFKLEAAEGDDVEGYYYLRTYKPDGTVYAVWGDPNNGYFNSQPASGSVCFSIGKTAKTNGQDIVNGAVWALEEDGEGKIAIKNIGTGLYLKDAAPAKYEDPTYFTFCTLKEDIKKGLANVLTSANEYYTYSNDNEAGTAKAALKGVIDTAQGVYDDGASTADDISAQVSALNDAIEVYFLSGATPVSGHPWDMTFKIVNPSFDAGNYDGWTATSTYNGKLAIQGGTRMEFWGGTATNRAEVSFNVYQEITGLPDGVYTISADMYNSLNGEGGDYTEFAPTCGVYGSSVNEQVTLVDVEGTELNTYTTDEITVYGGKLIVGVKNTVTPIAARWFLFDNFKLSFVRQFEEAEYLTIAKAAYDVAKANAETVEGEINGKIPTAAYTALQTAISDNTVTSETLENYKNATIALVEATETANALVEPFATYKAMKPTYTAIADQDVYTDGSGAKTTFNEAVAAADLAVENATDEAGINAQITALATAAKAFVKAIDIVDGKSLDITGLIVNPHFTEGKGGKNIPNGWTLESGTITEHRLQTHNFEAYHMKFNLSQTITDLPKGTYKVTLQGFARHDGTATDKTTLYCGIKSVAVKDIKAEWSTTSFFNDDSQAMGDTNKDLSYEKDGVGTVYQPNGMTGAYYWFQETNPVTSQPFYTSEVETLITEDGDLKIGFMCETTTDWVIWDNFHLYYYGSAIDVTLDEAEGSSYSEDIENANVTLKKTIAEGWNTIVLPIEVTKEDIGATELYSYTGDDASGVLQFATATKIEPNVPYLMKADAASSEAKKFTGVTVKAATDLTAAGDAFNFVGTYTGTTATENDYLLTATAFAKAMGGNTIKAYRAFIQKKAAEPEARELKISIDGVITGIEAIDGKAVNSNAAIYNLAGQKVKNAQKGLYIQNGKKYIVK